VILTAINFADFIFQFGKVFIFADFILSLQRQRTVFVGQQLHESVITKDPSSLVAPYIGDQFLPDQLVANQHRKPLEVVEQLINDL
jgi:hypothetical protein